jgi:type II secretory pathway pseudopilin PulG
MRRIRGFSLIELVVSGALFLILCVAILSVYRAGLTTESVTAQRTVLQDSLQTGMRVLDHDISEASASLVTSTSQSVTVQIPAFNTDGSPNGTYDFVTFAASGTGLYQSVIPGINSARKAYSDKRVINYLPVPYPSPGLFSYWTRVDGNIQQTLPIDATIVRVWLRQSAKYGKRTQNVDLSQDIRMRNR